MADYETAMDALARIRHACRAPFVRDPGGGTRTSAHRARVLAYLDEEDPAMVGELAEHLGVTASTMSLTLKRLEEAGYVRRDRDPLDGRVVNVRLTGAGARVREAQREMDPERVDRLLGLLGPGERPEVLRTLARLGEAADRLLRREREDVEAQL
jgi:DNA-binding MarR family transcriptional regulator